MVRVASHLHDKKKLVAYPTPYSHPTLSLLHFCHTSPLATDSRTTKAPRRRHFCRCRNQPARTKRSSSSATPPSVVYLDTFASNPEIAEAFNLAWAVCKRHYPTATREQFVCGRKVFIIEPPAPPSSPPASGLRMPSKSKREARALQEQVLASRCPGELPPSIMENADVVCFCMQRG